MAWGGGGRWAPAPPASPAADTRTAAVAAAAAARQYPLPRRGWTGQDSGGRARPHPMCLPIPCAVAGGVGGAGTRARGTPLPPPPYPSPPPAPPPLRLPLSGAPPVTPTGPAARREHVATRRPTRCSGTSGAAVAGETPLTPRLGRRATPRAWPSNGPRRRASPAGTLRGRPTRTRSPPRPRTLPAPPPLCRRGVCGGPVPVTRSPWRPPRSPHSQTNQAGWPAGHGRRRPPIGADGAPHGAAVPQTPLTAAARRRQSFKPRRQRCDMPARLPTPPAGVAEAPPSSPPAPPPPQPMPPPPNQHHSPQPPPSE